MTTREEIFRRKDLARIHMAATEAGLDQEAYRDFLRGLTGKDSAKDLDARQRFQVLQALAKLGSRSASGKPFPGRPARQGMDKEALIRKVEALLADAKRPWGYANAMAKRMFQVDMVQWLDADQLHRLVAALNYDAQRHGRE